MSWMMRGEDQARAIEELVKSNSERITAIVGGALLDRSLDMAIRSRMADDYDRRRKLFGPTAPLGGQPKVTLGFLLYMIDENTAKAMEAIYEIRNQFAHNLKMSFESKDEKMTRAMDNLSLHERYTHYPNPFGDFGESYPLDPVTDGKSRFIENLKLCLLLLRIDQDKHLPNSNLQA